MGFVSMCVYSVAEIVISVMYSLPVNSILNRFFAEISGNGFVSNLWLYPFILLLLIQSLKLSWGKLKKLLKR